MSLLKSILLLLTFLLITSAVFAEDSWINHPIEHFDITRPDRYGKSDTVFMARVTFDPMPEYQKESTVNVEYSCHFDSDTGTFIRVTGYDYKYLISPMEMFFHLPKIDKKYRGFNRGINGVPVWNGNTLVLRQLFIQMKIR